MAWDPWLELEYVRKRMQRLIEKMGESFNEEAIEPMNGGFPIDVAESEDELVIKANFPGFDKEDIQIRATKNTMDIAAQHKQKKIEQTEKMYRAERRIGALRREFALPVEVKPETAKTSFEKGVLEIRFMKAKPAKKAKKIKVE